MLKVKQGDVEKFDIEAYQYNAEIMGEVNLSCDVYLNVALDYFSLEMYVNINGENLYLSSFEPTGVKNTDNIYPKYSLVFESKRVELKRKYFRDLTSETGIDWGTEYSFYGNIADFATRFQKNLTKYFLNNEWSIEVYGNHSQDVSVLFEASNLYLFDALKQMSETWDKEWRIVSSGATNVIQVGFPQETLDHNFEYEGGNAGGGLTVIQKEVDTSNIITRMLSAGSTKNIPYQYFRQLSESELEAGNVQDPNVAPIFSNGYYNLMPACFRRYITGWNEGNNGTTYSPPRPTYTPEFWKGYDDGRATFFGISTYNPITYYDKNINTWGEREGIVEVNEDIFPTISGIDTRDEVVDVEQVLANEETKNISIIRHHLDYTASTNLNGQTKEIGEIIIGTANNEEFNYRISSLIIPANNNSFTVDIKYNGVTEFSETHTCDATTEQVEINNTVKLLLDNATYKVFITINAYTFDFLVSETPSEYSFLRRTKSVYNNANQVLSDYFHIGEESSYIIKMNKDFAHPYKIKSITNTISYIEGSMDVDILVCNCSFILKLQADYGDGNYIDAPAYIDDEGIVYESYQLYTLIASTNQPDTSTIYFKFYLNQNYDYRLVTRIVEITPNYRFNAQSLLTFLKNKNVLMYGQITLQAESYLAWGTGDYAANFPTIKSRIDQAITDNKFTASQFTTFLNGLPQYIVHFNQPKYIGGSFQPNIFTQKIGRPYKGYFSVWIKDIGFNINDYKSSQPAQLNFTTGAIAGEDYLFEILEVTPDTSRTSSAYRLKCTKSDADKDATGLAIPNTFKQGQAGDKFILLNINMPYTPYVLNAEERLETYVKAELDKVCDAKRAFSIEIYDPFISSFAETNKLITGNYIKIKHTNLIGSGSTATVQIKGITITQSKGDMFPKFAIILSEESSITRPTITRRGGGIIGDLYRRYSDLGDRLGNVTRNVSSINTNLGRTINVDTFNNNYRQVSGVNKEINALALSAKTTADEKNKCWTTKPIPPYYKGDQWLVDSGDVVAGVFLAGDTVYCKTTRLTGVFTNSDWGLSRYKGITEINTSINDFSTNVIGAIPSGSTVIEEINTVKGTAEGKNKGWTTKPTPPYYVGDQWLVDAGDVGSTGLTAGDVLFCNTIRETGDFNLADWGGNRYIGEKEVNESIDDFSVQVIGEIPIGKTVFGKGDSLETKLNEVSLKVNNKTRIELNEVPDGTRTLFTASKIFLAGTADVYANRLKQYKGFDYTEATANSILFAVAPKTEDVLVLEAVENTNNEKIVFVDSAVKALCATNWGSDGEITYAQATIVTDLGSVFTGNSTIISFDELQYFTSLNLIGINAFYYCSKLTSIIIPNSVTSIDAYAFFQCFELKSITIPNSITSIGNYAFQSCYILSPITIPNSVTSIGEGAFYSCASLTSIIIPNSVISIDDYAFYNCTSLISISIDAITPPTLGFGVFTNDTNLTNIYVPAASVDAYKAAAGWSDYADIISQII